MFKKLFGKKRSFRKMLTPVAAIVMLAQPAGNVIKAIPENIDIQQNDAINIENGAYLMTLLKYCEKTEGVNLNSVDEQLNHVKEKIGKDEQFKFGIMIGQGQEIDGLIILTKPEEPQASRIILGKTGNKIPVGVYIRQNEINALKNHITENAKQELVNKGFLANDEEQGGQNLNQNVGNELNHLLNLVQNVNNENQPLLNNDVVGNAQGQIPGQNQDPNMINQNVKNNVVNAPQEQGQNNNNDPVNNPVNNQNQQNQGQNNNNGVGIGTFMLGVAIGVGGKMAYDVVGNQNNAGGDSEYSEGETETEYEDEGEEVSGDNHEKYDDYGYDDED